MKKEIFLKAVARQQNAMSMAETRMQLLEKALDDGSNETRIFDFTIPNICYEATVDIVLNRYFIYLYVIYFGNLFITISINLNPTPFLVHSLL